MNPVTGVNLTRSAEGAIAAVTGWKDEEPGHFRLAVMRPAPVTVLGGGGRLTTRGVTA